MPTRAGMPNKPLAATSTPAVKYQCADDPMPRRMFGGEAALAPEPGPAQAVKPMPDPTVAVKSHPDETLNYVSKDARPTGDGQRYGVVPPQPGPSDRSKPFSGPARR